MNEDRQYCAIADYISRQPLDVRKHLSIKKPLPKQPFAIHISKNKKIDKMTPRFSKRQGSSEDLCVARICVTDYIFNCILAYAAVFTDYEYGNPAAGGDFFRGGWYIYTIDYKYALDITPALVYDYQNTKEYWLVNYMPFQTPYKPVLSGSFFIKDHRSAYRANRGIYKEYSFYLNTTTSMYFSKDKFLPAGSYQFKICFYERPNETVLAKDLNITDFKSISNDEFLKEKNETVSLLNFDNYYLEW